MTVLDSPDVAAPDDVDPVATDAVDGGDVTSEATGAGGRRAWVATLAALDARLGEPTATLGLTLLLILLGTSDQWFVAIPAVVLCVFGIMSPAVTARPRFWFALAAVLGAAALAGRWQVDNHQYLIAYWCLALGLAAASPDAERVRRMAARALLALVFVLAVFWKATSPDFVDGSFMRYTLLTDTRFSEVATLVGGVSPEALADNRALVKAVGDPASPPAPVALHGSARIDLLARALTGWTLLIEAAVALAFLVPWRRLVRFRDALLITFILTTYAVAPVLGFGWVLVCLGLAQHDRSRRWIPLAYLASFLAVQAFTAPWPSLFGIA